MERLVFALVKFYFRLLGAFAPERAAAQAFRLFITPRRRPRAGERSQRVLDAAEKLEIRDHPARLELYRWRPEGAGEELPIILFVHGWESQSAAFAAWIEPVLAAGFEALAIDLPAHGRSEGRRISMPDAVAAVRQVTDGRAERLHAVVGHSFGAVCSAYAVDGALGARGPLPVESLVFIAGGNRARDLFDRVAGLFGLSERVRARFLALLEQQSGLPIDAFAVSSALGRADVRTLVIHDRGDVEVPFADGEVIAELPRARLYATEGLGHRRILKDPGVIEQALAFMTVDGG